MHQTTGSPWTNARYARLGSVLGWLCLGAFITAATASSIAAPPVAVPLPSKLHADWYQWVDRNRLLMEYRREDVGGRFIALVDVDSGECSALPLPDWFEPSPDPILDTEWRLSPSHTLLLARGDAGRVVFDMNGSVRARWREDDSEVRWSPDSNSWLETVTRHNTTRVLVRSLSASGHRKVRNVAAYSLRGEWAIAGFTTANNILGISPTTTDDNSGMENVTIRNITNKKARDVNWALRLPHMVTVGDIAISPDGTQIAWLLYMDPCWSYDHFTPGVGNVTADVWISNTDGSDLHQACSFEPFANEAPDARAGRYVDLDPGVSELEWLPDGTAISFWWKQRIWTAVLDEHSKRTGQ